MGLGNLPCRSNRKCWNVEAGKNFGPVYGAKILSSCLECYCVWFAMFVTLSFKHGFHFKSQKEGKSAFQFILKIHDVRKARKYFRQRHHLKFFDASLDSGGTIPSFLRLLISFATAVFEVTYQ